MGEGISPWLEARGVLEPLACLRLDWEPGGPCACGPGPGAWRVTHPSLTSLIDGFTLPANKTGLTLHPHDRDQELTASGDEA